LKFPIYEELNGSPIIIYVEHPNLQLPIPIPPTIGGLVRYWYFDEILLVLALFGVLFREFFKIFMTMFSVVFLISCDNSLVLNFLHAAHCSMLYRDRRSDLAGSDGKAPVLHIALGRDRLDSRSYCTSSPLLLFSPRSGSVS
jgi:hypothetical protein